MRSFEEHKIEV